MNFNPTRSLIGALALASTALAAPAFATEGYFQAGYGTVQKAEAGAGVANPQDAMALSINPAGLVDLPHMITGGVTLFMPFRGYTATGPGGLTAPGPDRGRYPRIAVDPRNRIHIAYYDLDAGAVRYVRREADGRWIEPVVVEYLKTPPGRETLMDIVAATGEPVRAILREKGVLLARKDANRVYYRVGDARTLQLIGMMREVFCGD